MKIVFKLFFRFNEKHRLVQQSKILKISDEISSLNTFNFNLKRHWRLRLVIVYSLSGDAENKTWKGKVETIEIWRLFIFFTKKLIDFLYSLQTIFCFHFTLLFLSDLISTFFLFIFYFHSLIFQISFASWKKAFLSVQNIIIFH